MKSTNMVKITSGELDDLLGQAGLSKTEFARLRNLTLMGIQSWVRKERQKAPGADLFF